MARWGHVTIQFAAFSMVGVVASVVHYSMLIMLVERGLTNPVAANLVAYILGGIVSYLLNRRYAFRSKRVHAETAWRFAIVAGLGLLLTGIFMYVFDEVLGVQYILAAVMTSGVVLFWSFVANWTWTFGNS